MNDYHCLNIDLQYFANVNWYKKVIQYQYIEFNQYESHAKMSFRNRLWLCGADGLLTLSIPLEKSRDEKQAYRDLRIVRNNWQTIHFRTILSCYNRSPWFEYYRDDLSVLYQTPFEFLYDWNLACFDWLNHHASLLLHRNSSPGGCHPAGATRRVNWTNRFRPQNRGEWLEATGGIVKYGQVFEDRVGFVPGLSILDLLFCEGPGAVRLLG